jgi:MFS family permease
MTTYALTTLQLSQTVSFGVIIVAGVFAVVFEISSGLLSDRFGRKPVMLIPGFMLLISILPAFWIISTYRTTFTFYAAVAWLATLQALAMTPVIVTITESLPKSIRSGAVATIYAFAISIFGGTTQLTITWLLDISKDPLAPAYYWTSSLIVGLIAMALVTESAPVRLKARPRLA